MIFQAAFIALLAFAVYKGLNITFTCNINHTYPEPPALVEEPQEVYITEGLAEALNNFLWGVEHEDADSEPAN